MVRVQNIIRGDYEKRPKSWQFDFLRSAAPTLGMTPSSGRLTGSLTGTLYVDSSTYIPYVYNSGWQALTISGSASAASLDAAAAVGSVISDLSSAVGITESASSNALLYVTQSYTSATADMVNLDNYGTGDTLVLKDGGTEMIAFEDGGKVQFSASMTDTIAIDLPDDKAIEFGTSADVVAAYGGTANDLVFTPRADNITVAFGTSTAAMDLNLFGTGSETVTFDASEMCAIFEAYDIKLNDGDILGFGDGASATAKAGDTAIYQDGTNLVIVGRTDDAYPVHIGTSAVASDLKWFDDASGFALFDAGNQQLTLTAVELHIDGDDKALEIGETGGTTDGYIKFSSTELEIDVGSGGTGVNFGKDARTNVTLTGTSGSVVWDATNDRFTLNAGALYLGDDDPIGFGDGGGAGDPDVQYEWDTATTKFLYTGKAAETEICLGHATANAFDMRWLNVGTAASPTGFAFMDASEACMIFEGTDIKVNDADIIGFGDGASATAKAGDVALYFDGTQLVFEGRTDDAYPIHFGTSTVASDVKWWDDASGFVLLDAGSHLMSLSAVDIDMADDDKIIMGTTGGSTDFYMEFASNNLHMNVGSGGSSIIVGEGADTNFILTGATSGATMTYDAGLHCLFVEGGASDVGYIKVHDSDILAFGDGASAAAVVGDATLTYAAGDLKLDTGAGGSFTSFTISDSSDDLDVIWAAKTSGTITLDSTNKALTTSGADIKLIDNDHIYIGTGDGTYTHEDFDIYYDTSDLLIIPYVDDDGIVVGNGTKNADLTVYGQASSTMFWDASLTTLFFEGGGSDVAYVKLNDSDILSFGDGTSATASVGDVELIYTAAGSGTFTIDMGAAGALATIVMGSSSTDVDFQWNAGTSGSVLFDSTNKQVSITGDLALLADDNVLEFGTGGGTTDGYIKFSGSELEIDVGAGGTGVVIGKDADTNFVLNIADGTGAMTFDYGLATFFFEGGGDTAYIKIHDSDVLAFGDGASAAASIGDIELIYTSGGAGSFAMDQGAGGALATIAMGSASTDVDFRWLANTSGGVTFDSTEKQVSITGDLALLADDNAIELGTGGGTTDAFIKFSGTELEIDVGSGGAGVSFGVDQDTNVTCTTTSGSIVVDYGNDTMAFSSTRLIGLAETWHLSTGGAWTIDNASGQTGGFAGAENALDVTSTAVAQAYAYVSDVSDTTAPLATCSSLAGYAANFQCFPALDADGDYVAFGAAKPFCSLLLDCSGQAATWGADSTIWEYSSGASAWTTLVLGTKSDYTDAQDQDGDRSFQQTGTIHFVPPTNWALGTSGHGSQSAYWVRCRLTATTDLTQTIVMGDEASVQEPAEGFKCPYNGTITDIMIVDKAGTVHTTVDVKFFLMNFTQAALANKATAAITFPQDQRTHKQGSLTMTVAAGDILWPIVTQEDTGNEVTNADLILNVTRT